MSEKTHHITAPAKQPAARSSLAKKVTWIGFAANVALMLLKFVAGILGRSSAMIADAVHSLSDFLTDIVVIASFRMVDKPVDATHDYGHGKFETLATTFVAVTLLGVGIGILWASGEKIVLSIKGKELLEPGWIAFAAAVVSIFIKEMLYRYQVLVGQKINSQAIVANAWHHRSDALSSVATMFGIGGAILLGDEWNILDPVAALLVSLLIIKVAVSILWDSIQELLEVSLGSNIKDNIREVANSVDGAEEPHNIRTRKIGNYIAIELHVRIDRSLNVAEAHDIAVEVENKLKESFGADSFVTVHIDPQHN